MRLFVGLSVLFIIGASADPSCNEHKGSDIANNGYQDIRVRIDSTVPEDSSIIDNIKKSFTSASNTLFTALKKRGYFKEVRIIIPSTWKSQTQYLDANGKDLDENANEFLVAPANPSYGDTPYVSRSVPACGHEGDYVHMTTGYLKSAKPKEIVQKFAEQRFGVFPEYYNTHKQPNIYSNYPFDAKICTPTYDPAPTTCPEFYPAGAKGDQYELNGKACHPCKSNPSFASTNTPPPACHEYVHEYSGEVHTSLLFNTDSDVVYEFCDDISHNKFAKNEHNDKCNLRSAWSVIGANLDFSKDCIGAKTDPNPPNPSINDTVPNFVIVRNNDPRSIVFVLDISSSMNSNTPSRINVLHQATTAAVECMNAGEKVGVVDFGFSAKQLLPLTEITNEASRQKIQNAMPKSAYGNTAIGQGLEKGIQVLKNGLTDTKGARLVLVSDGEENVAPCACSSQVQKAIGDAKVRIDTVAISTQASPIMLSLANKWGGTWFFLNTNGASWQNAMQQAVSQLCQLTRPQDRPGDTVEVISTTTTSNTGSVEIDSTIGGNTVFLFLATNQNGRISVTVTEPNGTTIDSTSPYYRIINNGQQISIRIPFAQTGTWKYSINRQNAHSAVNAASPPAEASEISLGAPFIDCSSYLKYCTRATFAQTVSALGSRYVSGSIGEAPEPVENAALGSAEAVAILVTSQSSNPNKPLTVKTAYSYDQITDVTKQLFVMYTSVFVGQSAVQDATVESTVIDNKGQKHSVVMKDDGEGVDDEPGDGIYSGYYSDFSSITVYKVAQRFQSSTKVTSNSTAYYFDDDHKKVTLGKFQRSTNNPTFEVTLQNSSQKNKDVIPPSRINDFAATFIDRKNNTVAFKWTATGKDYDQGTASKYIIKMSESSDNITTDFDSLPSINASMTVSGDLTPVPAGSSMSIVLGPFKDDRVVYFAMKAEDDSGNLSPLSAVAPVNFTQPIIPPSRGATNELHFVAVAMFTFMAFVLQN